MTDCFKMSCYNYGILRAIRFSRGSSSHLYQSPTDNQSLSSLDDTAASEINDNRIHPDNGNNSNALKDESCRLSSTSNPSSNHLYTNTEIDSDSNRNPITSNQDNNDAVNVIHSNTSQEATPIEPSCTPELQQSTADRVLQNVDISTTDNQETSGSSGRLWSTDSDGAGQDSVVTVEVISIPRSVADENTRQDELGVSADGEEPAPAVVEDREEERSEQTEVVEMSDQQRLEEKLRQFENDAKERQKESQSVHGTDSTVQMSESEKQRRRNLIFDEERFEETFLKCLICREVYNETDKLPKMLHCHHTFCMDCLYQMYRVEGEFRQSLTSVFRNMPLTVKIQCPTCREGIIISEAELRRLPNDHTIMELLCFVNKTVKNDVQYCPKHQMQPLNFFCEPCIMPVCCDCTVLDHKDSKGHRVVNVDEAMKKYTPIVEDTLSDIRKEKATLAGKKEALENTQEDLNRIQSGISDQIRKVFDNIREVLDERERELHDVAVSEVDRKQGIIEGHLNTIAEREADLNAEFNSLQLATDDKDISLIFTGHKSARDLLTRKVFIPTNSTAGFSITFQFSSRADTVIKQQVANLGDVIFHS